jgi:hypothetical protein
MKIPLQSDDLCEVIENCQTRIEITVISGNGNNREYYYVTINRPDMPKIVTEPENVKALPNTAAVFSIDATSNSVYPITYQWKRNGVVVAGATAATIEIPTVHENFNGYAMVCEIYSIGGDVRTSRQAYLTG